MFNRFKTDLSGMDSILFTPDALCLFQAFTNI
ncbi:hypothetical protein NIASO_20445 [Niabella soli DSM 19437]|uniref:Uncharacterized protein n=1 Tax=Niabella soli DSM 19437 TaxID=929713 RepID=W0F9E1_9BACT|nr:hypothetical protein NIASO_20445 [Niabella soli DSM 19437]